MVKVLLPPRPDHHTAESRGRWGRSASRPYRASSRRSVANCSESQDQEYKGVNFASCLPIMNGLPRFGFLCGGS